ncbi:MAG: hypothetical protein DIU73_005760, partial [Actinomycetes bacterium]
MHDDSEAYDETEQRAPGRHRSRAADLFSAHRYREFQLRLFARRSAGHSASEYEWTEADDLYDPIVGDDSPTMSGDFYGFRTNKAEAESSVDQWQVINHFNWEISSELTLRNILAYTDLETDLVSPVFATDFWLGGRPFGMTSSDLSGPDINTTAQNSFVAELQLLGSGFDDRLEWQAGLYYERSKPDGTAGSRPTRGVNCLSVASANP